MNLMILFAIGSILSMVWVMIGGKFWKEAFPVWAIVCLAFICYELVMKFILI